jgi:hypothetical protein
VGKRVLINEAVKMLFERTGHFAWTPRARAVQQALGSLMGKALDPLAQCRIGKVEGLGDGGNVVAGDDLPHGLGAAKDTGCFGMLEDSIQGSQGMSGKVALERAHRVAPCRIMTSIQSVTNSDTLIIGTMWLRLKFCSFC